MSNVLISMFVAALFALAIPTIRIQPALETQTATGDTDDPALWIHPVSPSKSLIVGTVKLAAPAGGLVVYSLDGKLLDRVDNVDRPNNVDVQGDICVVTERLKRQLRIYRIRQDKPYLTLLGTLSVFSGEPDESGAPMGIALYQRSKDKALFAIVSRKTGPRDGYLWQYRLNIAGGLVTGERVRSFGAFSGTGEIEAVAVDDAAGLVYYSDEDCCIRVYSADPDGQRVNLEVARFGESGSRGNREGIAVAGDRVIVTDQLVEGSEYHVYRRYGFKEVAIWKGAAESTDGIEAVTTALGPLFPKGVLVAMNSARHNFQLYRLPR